MNWKEKIRPNNGTDYSEKVWKSKKYYFFCSKYSAIKISSVKFGSFNIFSRVIVPFSLSVQVARLDPVVVQPDDPDIFKEAMISCAIRTLSSLIALSSIGVRQRNWALKISEDSVVRNCSFELLIPLLPWSVPFRGEFRYSWCWIHANQRQPGPISSDISEGSTFIKLIL